MDKNNIHDRIENILKSLCEGLVEKDEAMRLALLAAVAGESIFFLGLPGTAKSMVSRRLKSAFKGGNGKPLRYFEYLMNQFSTPDEIFGPVSLKSLEEDKYERIIKGYLPDAEVAFLDEIWKASPAIQNTLLTIINEKKFHNGNEVKDVPLKALISASNELPAENQGLEALWDRFLIRLMVNPVQSKKSFVDLVCGQPVQAEIGTLDDAISIDELEEWKNEINRITIPDEVETVIDAIHSKMWKLHEETPENNKFYISDRRWMKIVHLLKTSAFLNGRPAVDLMDCDLMSYCIWNSNELIEKLKKDVENCIIDDGHKFFGTVEEIKTQIKDYDKFVEDGFFKKEPKKYQMKDGTLAYKIVNPQEIKSYENCTPYYISSNYIHSGYNRNGAYFNDNEELIGDSDYFIYDDSFKIDNDTIIWKDGCSENEYSATIEIELVKSPQLYGYYKKGEPKLFKMNNEEKTPAYKIKKPVEINSYRQIIPYYVSPNYEHHNYNRCKGAFFDQEKNLMGYYYGSYNFHIYDGSFRIDGDTISWIDGYRYRYKEQISAQIEMKPDIFIKGNDVELQKIKEKATNKHIEISNLLVSEFKRIEDYIKCKTKQYGSNLFVDKSVCDVIISDVKRAKDVLDEAAVDLNKIRFKYENLKSDE
ncbi:MAG: AAA family ATPase [Salinivirgaceae bacterium]|nr:AAA family ATPase [Salinivirgaceae bacterium]